jgi:hypothetical protein
MRSLNYKFCFHIFMTAFDLWITRYKSSPQVFHTFIILLRGNDLFTQQWCEGYVVQRQVRKYSGTTLSDH